MGTVRYRNHGHEGGISVSAERFPSLVARASVEDCGGNDGLSYVVFTAGGYYRRVLRDCDGRIPLLNESPTSTPVG